MDIKKEIIKILRQPVNERGLTSKRTTPHALPYYTLSENTAKRLTRDIMRVCREKNKEIAEELLKEDVGKLVDTFGKYPTKGRKFVTEGFSLARIYILRNKMKF